MTQPVTSYGVDDLVIDSVGHTTVISNPDGEPIAVLVRSMRTYGDKRCDLHYNTSSGAESTMMVKDLDEALNFLGAWLPKE